jgi:hypothetical protein
MNALLSNQNSKIARVKELARVGPPPCGRGSSSCVQRDEERGVYRVFLNRRNVVELEASLRVRVVTLARTNRHLRRTGHRRSRFAACSMTQCGCGAVAACS